MPHETSDFISADDEREESKSESPACSKVSANAVWKTFNAEIEIPSDRFWLKHGDNESGDHQVRLEPDGRIYLSYTEDCRRNVNSVTLSLAEFDVAFRKFVDDCITKRSNP